MNRRLVFVLLTAFIIAAGCSFLVYKILGIRIASAQPTSGTVVVAARNIPLGTVLRSSDLNTSVMALPLPVGAVSKPEAAIGRGVLSDIYQGEPVLESRLAAVGAGGGLAATIPPGMRACAVRVNEVVGLAGFATPGMRVDVLVAGTGPGGSNSGQGTKVKTLLQNIEVLSAGTDIEKDAEGKPVQVPVVNLLVSPQQAELLSLAGDETKIQLVLRNPLDTQIAHTDGSAMGQIFADTTSPPKPRPHPVAKPAGEGYVVQVLNGDKHYDEKFASSGGNNEKSASGEGNK